MSVATTPPADLSPAEVKQILSEVAERSGAFDFGDNEPAPPPAPGGVMKSWRPLFCWAVKLGRSRFSPRFGALAAKTWA